MKNHFQRTEMDVNLSNKVLNSLEEIGVMLGLDATTVNPTNAQQRVRKIANEYMKLSEKANELGYSSVAMALKALSQVKESITNTDLGSLPEVFLKVPSVWLSGKPKTKNEPGFAPLRVRDAERQHRVIAPLLIEAWGLADEDVQDRITRGYLTMSVSAFESELYKYIYDLEPTPLEEEFQSIQPDTDDDMAKSLHLVTHPDVIYGVVKKNEI